jgi:antitoxin (DNA-binding transcriptional repressor) of toxin-antitoxin stability system
MKSIGVKTLKARLSEYLRLVRAGEVVLVTDRNEVVAELRPTNRQSVVPPTLDDRLQLLAEQGQATLRTEEIRRWPGPMTKVKLRDFSSQALLDSIREDSR